MDQAPNNAKTYHVPTRVAVPKHPPNPSPQCHRHQPPTFVAIRASLRPLRLKPRPGAASLLDFSDCAAAPHSISLLPSSPSWPCSRLTASTSALSCPSCRFTTSIPPANRAVSHLAVRNRGISLGFSTLPDCLVGLSTRVPLLQIYLYSLVLVLLQVPSHRGINARELFHSLNCRSILITMLSINFSVCHSCLTSIMSFLSFPTSTDHLLRDEIT